MFIVEDNETFGFTSLRLDWFRLQVALLQIKLCWKQVNGKYYYRLIQVAQKVP